MQLRWVRSKDFEGLKSVHSGFKNEDRTAINFCRELVKLASAHILHSHIIKGAKCSPSY